MTFLMKPVRYQRSNLWDRSGFDQLTNLRDEFNSLFESAFTNGNASNGFSSWAPALDVYEDKNNILVRAEVPGLTRDAIDLQLHDDVLTISGERRSEKPADGSRPSRQERFFGRFNRSISLQKRVDSSRVSAAYKDGILTVTLPKAEEAKPKQIEIKN